MKYQGSKNKIVKDILPIMLSHMQGKTVFIDAFCGSCSIIQDVPLNYVRIANDNNRYLIAMWKSLISGKKFPSFIPKELYDEVRDCFHGKNNKYEDDVVGWVGYMTSFNGRMFSGGYSGHKVKVKKGKYRDYIAESINNITEQLKKT